MSYIWVHYSASTTGTTFYVPAKHGWGLEGNESMWVGKPWKPGCKEKFGVHNAPFALCFEGPTEKKQLFQAHIKEVLSEWKCRSPGSKYLVG